MSKWKDFPSRSLFRIIIDLQLHTKILYFQTLFLQLNWSLFFFFSMFLFVLIGKRMNERMNQREYYLVIFVL